MGSTEPEARDPVGEMATLESDSHTEHLVIVSISVCKGAATTMNVSVYPQQISMKNAHKGCLAKGMAGTKCIPRP